MVLVGSYGLEKVNCEGQQSGNHPLASVELGFYTECSEEQYILWLPQWEQCLVCIYHLSFIIPNFTHHPQPLGTSKLSADPPVTSLPAISAVHTADIDGK